MKIFLALLFSALVSVAAAQTIPATQTLHVDTRAGTGQAALAAQLVSKFASGDPAYLEEAGQQGMFQWSPTDHSADITAQGAQIGANFVAPNSDTDGSSGAWVRVSVFTGLNTLFTGNPTQDQGNEFEDLGTPIDWKTAYRFELIRSDSTFGTGSVFTTTILSNDAGLTLPGTGPYASYNTGALFLESKRTNYLTSTTDGQNVGLYVNVFTGRNSLDASAAILGSARKTVAGSSTGDLLAFEFRSITHSAVSPLAADIMGHVSLLGGWFTQAAGYTWEDKFLGYYTSCLSTVVHGCFAGNLVVDISATTAGWEWLLAGQASPTDAPYFGIAGHANATYNDGAIYSNSGGSAGDQLILESQNLGGAAGPSVQLYRNSASPLATDAGGSLRFDGEDSAGNTQTYGNLFSTFDDVTSTSEDGSFGFQTVVAGTLAQRLAISAGVRVGSSAVTDPGAGAINVSAGYFFGGTQVVAARDAGFTNIAGTANENCGALDIATTTATDANIRATLACLKGVMVALTTHGLIGP